MNEDFLKFVTGVGTVVVGIFTYKGIKRIYDNIIDRRKLNKIVEEHDRKVAELSKSNDLI